MIGQRGRFQIGPYDSDDMVFAFVRLSYQGPDATGPRETTRHALCTQRCATLNKYDQGKFVSSPASFTLNWVL
jgi:hypothetical protein